MANKRGRSEKKTTFWGKEYVQHYDSKGNKSGRSEQKETFFGKKYTQHSDTKGEKRGHSEKKETWTGRQYTQKYNASGEKSGRSEKKTGFFGNRYTQHYDREGRKSDWSERKETFFGKRYNQRYGDEPSSRSSASTGPGNPSRSYGGTYGSSSASSYARSSDASSPSASAVSGSSSIRPGAVIGLLIAAGLVVGLISLIGNLRGSRRLNSDGPQSLGNAYINTLQLNVRRGPGTEHGVVTRLTRGTLVVCLERSRNAHGENWLKIRSESSEGWVNEEYLSRTSPVPDTRVPSTVPESSPNEVEAQTQSNQPQGELINRDGRLAVPRLLSPADAAVMNYYPRHLTMEWESVPSADTYTVEIQFQGGSTWNDLTEFLSNNGYVGYVEPVKLTDTKYSLNWVGINPGRWRVWAVDAKEKAGRKSEWRQFRFTR